MQIPMLRLLAVALLVLAATATAGTMAATAEDDAILAIQLTTGENGGDVSQFRPAVAATCMDICREQFIQCLAFYGGPNPICSAEWRACKRSCN